MLGLEERYCVGDFVEQGKGKVLPSVGLVLPYRGVV